MKLLLRFTIAIIFLPLTEGSASTFSLKSGRNLNAIIRLKTKGLLVRGGHVHNTSSSKQISSRRSGRKKNIIDSIESTDKNLPTIKAVLIPRVLAIPQIIRMVSAFLFSSSMLESLRTCGKPFQSAVVSTLQSHGITLLLAGGKVVSEDFSKITPLDIYLAKKICSSENNMLPPRHFPASLPLFGLFVSIFLYIGLTILFPKWFVEWNVCLKFQRYNCGEKIDKHHLDKLHFYLGDSENQVEQIVDADDMFYVSQFVNRNHVSKHASDNHKRMTGVAVLVKKSRNEVEISSDGSEEEISWVYETSGYQHPSNYFIETGQRRVYLKFKIKNGKPTFSCLDGRPDLHVKRSIKELIEKSVSGLSAVEDLEYAQERFGTYNNLHLPTPSVRDVFFARISTPLSILQLLGRILSALEENFGPAMMSICMTLGQHYMNAKKSITAARELSDEIQGNLDGCSETLFWVLRGNWTEVHPKSILPGDVFLLPKKEDILMPVDALVVKGNCVAQEAVITGECVPQPKIPIEVDSASSDCHLSIDSTNRNSILFAGTTVISSSGEITENDSPSMVKCLALATGSYSSKGEIVRALSKSSCKIGSISTRKGERDAIRLILVLSFCAILACSSLFVPVSGSSKKKTSGFRRIIQCTRICVASIPSDLPLALHQVVHSSSQILKKEGDVVCSELGALLDASQITNVVFDKTGTLTSSENGMKEVVTLDGVEHSSPLSMVVLAGSHSLIHANGKLVGDPLDIAALKFTGWKYDIRSRCFSGKKGKRLWQIKSFPFDAGRRMSAAIVLFRDDDRSIKLYKVIKGSHEGIRKLLQKQDCFGSQDEFYSLYDKKADELGSEGIRHIAMAVQDITHSSIAKKLFPTGYPKMSFKKKTTRRRNKEVEKVIQNAKIVATKCFHIEHFDNCSEYDFIGFACFDASLRPSTGRVIQEIRKSGTEVIMLTGDGPAAALAIAKKSDFFDRPKKVAYLSVDDTSNLIWHIASFANGQGSNFKDFNEENTKEILSKVDSGKYVIVAIGRAIEIMNDDNNESSLLMLQNLDKISVIARSSPQTKQYVVSTLRNHCEKKVMFVGDGVNDISAMKAADVSGAILNGYGSEDTNAIERDIENERRMEKLKDRKVGKDKSNQKIGQDRVKLKIEEALKSSDDPGHSMNALVKVLKEEYQRYKDLQRGGAKAARIMQKEERLRQALMQKVNTTSDDEEEGIESIAPGEASLAAAFTFLRPAIDGVDFVIRNGISSAASSLSSRRCDKLFVLFRYFADTELTIL